MTGLLQFMNQFQKMTGLHTHVPPTFTQHTKGARASRAPTTVPMERALRARPIGTVVFPFVCGVNVGGLLCGTSIDSTDSTDFADSIQSKK